ncbi:hypothetical protein BJ322DRAFT_1015452 [Thelephora terrestris]|uniref:CxC2-like cysteine cluster KDZ transposase-associated domain-containing protein n=1 Tax=Thelephora terrestris TaxID=56493 RepID=A0A9P6L127_9AGAM|nr:hypothetical protein BJ322DRAFT_1015452 [Thelephora terrestris]
MEQWVRHRSIFLDELLRLEGLGDASNCSQPCPDCSRHPATFRCYDCLEGTLRCSACTVLFHRDLPLHKIQRWNGAFFETVSLESLGLVINLSHSGGACPVNTDTKRIFVVDLSGYHFVRIRFCTCPHTSFLDLFRQFLRVRWFPASILQPKTVFTFDLLDTYHKISMQGKLNLYDFYTAIMQKTDNRGHTKIKYRYHEISRCVRQWRHLKEIKRGAAGHTSATIDELGDGALAIECPACPHPGRNLPPEWENEPDDKAWLYSLFVAIDANFRLKLKTRGITDPELGSGLAYFVNVEKFNAHLKRHTDEADIETCGTEFHAVNHANSKRSKDFTVSGVGAIVCRHGLIRKNGVVDLQKGERFVNMDYIFLSTMKDEKIKKVKVSYDIACRWSIKLFQRIQGYSDELHIPEDKFALEFFIPKFHLPAHGSSCHTRYSFNYRPGVGRTHGENIESGWAHTNPASISTREMGAGARHSALDGHWGGWNWRKIVGFGPLLLRNLREAINMAKKSEDACRDFEEHRPHGTVHEWKMIKRRWEVDPLQPDPYKVVETASNFSSAKRKLAEIEALDPTANNTLPHQLSPLSFVRMGLELEDQQYQVLTHLASKTPRTDPQKAEIQERRNALARRVKLWKTAQAVYMPQVSGYLPGERDHHTSEDSYEFDEAKPELWPLSLPSQLSPDERLLCHKGIAETELTLRLAQAQDGLVDLRRLRRTLRSLRTYFRSNVVGEGQKVQTKSRSVESGVQVRVNRVVRRYRLAYTALLSLDPTGDWRKEYHELTDNDNRGPGKELDEQGVGDGRYTMSWIWSGSSGSHDPSEQEVNETVRHEWMTCRARADRWKEESELLQEEMRRIIAFLEWKSTWWGEKAESRLGLVTADIQHGIDAYARRQADTYHQLAVSLVSQWLPRLLGLGLDPAWTKTYTWTAEIIHPAVGYPPGSSSVHESLSPSGLSSTGVVTPREKDGVAQPGDSDDEDDSDDEIGLDLDADCKIYNEGETSDKLGIGFEYDDDYYMS